MSANFLWNAGPSNGYINAAPLSITGTASSGSTSVGSVSPSLTALKGMLVQGTGIGAPDFVAANVSGATSFTISTGTTAAITGGALTIQQFPTLISGEASALANGAAVTSSYWNNTGVFRLGTDFDQALVGSIFFQAGGSFTPNAGGFLAGWWLPSFDGGTTFETAVATPSSTVMALSRDPDFTISFDNAAYAQGNVRYSLARIYALPPESEFKVLAQNNSGVSMPPTWGIMCGPVAEQY